jgi:hypothetical protein
MTDVEKIPILLTSMVEAENFSDNPRNGLFYRILRHHIIVLVNNVLHTGHNIVTFYVYCLTDNKVRDS